MAKNLESIVQLAAEKAHEISANSGNYMAFLTTAAHNFKYNFRDQLLIFAQKPDATACAEIKFWNKHGRWANRGTTGIALLVDTDRGYKLRHVFDMSDTNSREGRTIPIWQMKPQYEGPVAEALENSYGEFADKSDFPVFSKVSLSNVSFYQAGSPVALQNHGQVQLYGHQCAEPQQGAVLHGEKPG